MVREITQRVKDKCKVPLIVKLSPNVTDITETAKAARQGGADALSLINTLIGMKIDVNTAKPVLANNIGGLSGPAIRPIAVRMVWQVACCTDLPIIGMGGIISGEDAAEFIIAGATAVAVGSANIVNPAAGLEIKNQLTDYLKRKGIQSVSKLRGTVKIN